MEELNEERLRVVLEHWRHHSQEHAASYENWAGRVRQQGWPEVGELLLEAADLSRQINRVLERAASYL